MTTALEQQAVLGVFSHRTTYLPQFLTSVRDCLPHIPLIVKMRNGQIQENWLALLEDFKATNRRFWTILDDDITFHDSTIIHDCVQMMISWKLGAVGVYSYYDITDPKVQTNWFSITAKKVGWLPGYFMMIDSQKVGHIVPDQKLPWDNFGDADYCTAIRAAGYEIGLCPHIVRHEPAKREPNFDHEKDTRDYLWKKWGNFYFPSYIGNVLDWGI